MNIIVIAKKQYTISPSSDNNTLRQALKKPKYVAVLVDEGYDQIDELTETLDLIEEVTEEHRKIIVVFGEVVASHQCVLLQRYPQFEFFFINV
jgi:type II secretory pathway predicted ATPase ExeA